MALRPAYGGGCRLSNCCRNFSEESIRPASVEPVPKRTVSPRHVRLDGVFARSAVVPDALFGLRFEHGTEAHFMLEIDRGKCPSIGIELRRARTSRRRWLHATKQLKDPNDLRTLLVHRLAPGTVTSTEARFREFAARIAARFFWEVVVMESVQVAAGALRLQSPGAPLTISAQYPPIPPVSRFQAVLPATPSEVQRHQRI